MKKTNITKLLVSLLMVFTITFTNATALFFPQNNSSHVQLFADNSTFPELDDE